MAGKKLFVCKDRGVTLKDGSTIVGPGTEIIEGMLTPEMAAALLRAGHLREDSPGESPVDIFGAPTISAKERTGEDGIKAEGNKSKSTPRKWNLTDEQLRGKSLEDMNVMIVERGGKPQTTVEDAIGLLQAEL